MHYGGVLFVSSDLHKTEDFYWRVLGLRKISDFGSNITLKGGIFFQSVESWAQFLQKPQKDIRLQHHAAELFFEEDDMEAFLQVLNDNNVTLVHEMYTHDWGGKDDSLL